MGVVQLLGSRMEQMSAGAASASDCSFFYRARATLFLSGLVRPLIENMLEKVVKVMVVFSLSLLLRSRVTPRDCLRHPLSPFNTTFPFLLPFVLLLFLVLLISPP